MNRGPRVWMFSGQGSQYYRMGADLYAGDQVFRDTMDQCSDRVAPVVGLSLSDLLFRPREDRFEPFARTLYTHPALFSIQYSLAQSLVSRGLRPDIVLGYSLGEWVAHVVAGVISAEAALDLLVGQAQRLEATSPPGGMLAVLDSTELVERHAEWFDGTWVAARNLARHFVVSGETAAIAAVEERLKGHHVTTQRLPVSQPFHTPLMDRFRDEVVVSLESIPRQPPWVPLFSCRGVDVTGTDTVSALWSALREPIAFPEVLSMLEDQAPTYIDCGPSGTLSTFVKYNLPRAEHHRSVALVTPFDRNIEKIDALCLAEATGGHA